MKDLIKSLNDNTDILNNFEIDIPVEVKQEDNESQVLSDRDISNNNKNNNIFFWESILFYPHNYLY